MYYSLKFIGLWNYILLDNKNPKLVAIILKDKNLKNDAKLEYQKKCINRIII